MSRLARLSFSISPAPPVVGIAANNDPRSKFPFGDEDGGGAPFLLVGRDVFRRLCFSRVDVGEYVVLVIFRDFGLSGSRTAFSGAMSGRTGDGSLDTSRGQVPGR